MLTEAEIGKQVLDCVDKMGLDYKRAGSYISAARALVGIVSETESTDTVINLNGVTRFDRDIGNWKVTVEKVD